MINDENDEGNFLGYVTHVDTLLDNWKRVFTTKIKIPRLSESDPVLFRKTFVIIFKIVSLDILCNLLNWS